MELKFRTVRTVFDTVDELELYIIDLNDDDNIELVKNIEILYGKQQLVVCEIAYKKIWQIYECML